MSTHSLHTDITDLREFYASFLGQKSGAVLRRRIASLWHAVSGDVVLGLGYTLPYLGVSQTDSVLTIAAMPALQGAVYWPSEEKNRSCLVRESDMPFGAHLFNRVLLVHALENTEEAQWMMEEIWRVLTPGGRILVVVPNRRGLWSGSARSPFGHGRPYSMAQIKALMGKSNFTITRATAALFVPPVEWHWLWRFTPVIEALGAMLCPMFGGVLLLEAEKQIYASIKEPVLARKSKLRYATAATPAMR